MQIDPDGLRPAVPAAGVLTRRAHRGGTVFDANSSKSSLSSFI